jgi:hypothetical protein
MRGPSPTLASAATCDDCKGSPTKLSDLAEVAVSARSAKRGPMDPPQGDPATPPAARPDRLSIRHREPTLTREEPYAGNPHVRVCEEWGGQRPHLLGDATRCCAISAFLLKFLSSQPTMR